MVEDNLVAIMLGYEPPKQAPVLLKRGMGTQVRVTGVRSFFLRIKASDGPNFEILHCLALAKI